MAIIGAILGDIIGSRFEFNRPYNLDWKNVDLFTNECFFTDDTILTVATKYAIEQNLPFADIYKIFGKAYPDVGYGGSFENWLLFDKKEPYNSFGNGSAMRVSPVIDLFDDIDDVIYNAEQSAICTHNHPEGVKGAVVTAVCGWMAKNGATKQSIEEYASKQYSADNYIYPVSMSLSDIREDYRWSEICQTCVPIAIRCFLDSEDYESFIRNVLSIDCDADTISAIGGTIAEEFYNGTGFDNDVLLKRYLDNRLYKIVMHENEIFMR